MRRGATNLEGEFFGTKKSEYNEKQYKCILEKVEKLEVIKDRASMMN